MCAINSWLAPFFGDDVDYGSNDYSEEAEFYQDMGMGSNHVLEMLLASATSNTHHCHIGISEAPGVAPGASMKLPDISRWFAERQRFRERHRGISLSEEITVFGRPQLVYWLINCSTAEQCKILAEVLVNVVEHHEARMKSSSLGFTMMRQRRVVPTQGFDGSMDGVVAVRLEE